MEDLKKFMVCPKTSNGPYTFTKCANKHYYTSYRPGGGGGGDIPPIPISYTALNALALSGKLEDG